MLRLEKIFGGLTRPWAEIHETVGVRSEQAFSRTKSLRGDHRTVSALVKDRLYLLLRRWVFMPGYVIGASAQGNSHSYCSNFSYASAILIASDFRPTIHAEVFSSRRIPS